MLTQLDWTVVGLYFVLIGSILYWKISFKAQNTEDYFLAGRNLGWFVIGASIFASNIGSEHLVGLASAGADSGVVMGHYELHSYLILMLGWVFVPFYIRTKIFTIPEYLEKRFNSTVRSTLSLIALISYILTKVSVTVYAGGVVISTLTDLDFWTGALIIVLITGVYTIAGGFRAVVYTDTLQAFVLISGSILVTVIGLGKIGGWNSLYETVGSEHFNMWKSLDDPNYPWAGMLFGAPIVGIWYWCTDQYIVQRTLAAKNESEARRGTIFGGYLKILPLFIFIVPGMIAYALSIKGQLELTAPDQALPTLMANLLPQGVRGLVIGGLLAALMSSLSSVFNSSSTLFTVDIYKKYDPNCSEEKLVMIGRIATLVVVILGIIWIPIMKNISGVLYQYLQSVQSYIAPPITSLFLLAIFYKRVNTQGALAGLAGGFIIGMLRLIAELNKESLHGLLHSFATINFLYFAIYLFIISLIITVVVSHLYPAQTDEELENLTYATTTTEEHEKSRKSWNNSDAIHSIIVIGIVLSVFFYFTG